MSTETKFDKNVVADLLASAKEHFLKNGYEKASLRKICAGAGVTTGALYFSFENKEALFDALVEPTLKKMDKVLNSVEAQVLKENGKYFDEEKFNDFIFRFLVENRDGIRLLMGRASGSHYEDFAGKIYRHVERLMAHYADKVEGVEVDPALVKIMTHMYFTAVSDLMTGEFDHEEMMTIAGALRVSMEQGFHAMVEHQRAKG